MLVSSFGNIVWSFVKHSNNKVAYNIAHFLREKLVNVDMLVLYAEDYARVIFCEKY